MRISDWSSDVCSSDLPPAADTEQAFGVLPWSSPDCRLVLYPGQRSAWGEGCPMLRQLKLEQCLEYRNRLMSLALLAFCAEPPIGRSSAMARLLVRLCRCISCGFQAVGLLSPYKFVQRSIATF